MGTMLPHRPKTHQPAGFQSGREDSSGTGNVLGRGIASIATPLNRQPPLEAPLQLHPVETAGAPGPARLSSMEMTHRQIHGVEGRWAARSGLLFGL